MIDTPCVFCEDLVYASPKPETWELDWVTRSGKTIWVHYKCADELFEAIRRIQKVSDAIEDNPLTPRQTQILQLVADGMTRRQIAIDLNTSLESVNWQLHCAYKRMNTTCAPHAVAIGIREGIIK